MILNKTCDFFKQCQNQKHVFLARTPRPDTKAMRPRIQKRYARNPHTVPERLDFKHSHLKTSYAYEIKRISSPFVSVTTDQVRRADFERRELGLMIWKSILGSNNVQKNAFGNPNPNPSLFKNHTHCTSLMKVDQMKTNKTLGTRAHFLGLIYSNSIRKVLVQKKGTLARVRNRCVMTGRPNTITPGVAVSRICFRQLAGMGAIPGLFKI